MNAEQDFRRNFPSARGIPNRFGKQRQQRSRNRVTPYFIPPSTWTRDFFLLHRTDITRTPERNLIEDLNSSGLGKKKVVFSDKNGNHKHIQETLESYYPKLADQNGAFQLLKSQSGGSGVRNLIQVPMTSAGYTVSGLKEQCKSSLIYIKPLQKDIGIVIEENQNQEHLPESQCGVTVVCENCTGVVELSRFEQHTAICQTNIDLPACLPVTDKDLSEESCTPNKVSLDIYNDLKTMFSGENYDDKEISSVARSSSDLNDAIDKLLSKAQPSRGSPSLDKSCASSLNQQFGTMKDLLKTFRSNHLQSANYKLTVSREEIWRTGLTFYKKALSNPGILKKDLEVEFSGTGEDDSYDAGAIKIEFLTLMMKEFNQRIMVGEPTRVPRRGDSINYKLFGIFLGHSLLQGGPGFYVLQEWVYEYIIGNNDNNHLLKFISKANIPVHAGSSGVVDLLDALDGASSQEQLDKIVDENLQIINCSQWDPAKPINLTSKPFLIAELLVDELVRKRCHQIQGIVEGLKISGFYHFIVSHPSICRDGFCKLPEEFTVSRFKSLFGKENKVETAFEKIQSKTFFDVFLSRYSSDLLAKTFKFITGFEHIPPWGIDRPLALAFLEDDDEEIYPKALCCFAILKIPTVHSSQKAFDEHFLKALDIKGTGFSSGC